MKQFIAIISLFVVATAVKAQPQFTDLPVLAGDDIVITVLESTDECGTKPGIFQLHENGYTKIVDLEPMTASEPNLVLKRNSQRVLEVIGSIGNDKMEVRDYREFWIDECSKQSQYVLHEKPSLGYTVSVLH
ncbi:MAG: hypothetical protein HQ500_05300 [Flavobacteriales bacterium]|nr:hypothetical protein [Flavobacteriales bacterium]